VGVVAVGDAARDGVGLALTEGVMVLGTTVAVGDAQAVSRTKTMITINVFLDMLTFP
jgi:presenilin-like A22 family membrane protease